MSDIEGDEVYQKKSQEFVTKLVEFHEKCGTPLRRIPTLGGRELDVYHLYEKVKSLGGQEAVSQARLWGEVARSFKLPASVTSASYAVRQHYIKLLEKFEVYEQDPDSYFDDVHSNISQPTPNPVHRPNPSHRPPGRPSYRTTLTAVPQVPGYAPVPKLPIPPLPRVTFNVSSSSMPAQLQQLLSTITPHTTSHTGGSARDKSTGYDRLARSLLSGYPNEVDMAFNVLTILTYKTPGALPAAEFPRLVELMLGHVGVFPSSPLYDDMGMETLYHESWYPPESEIDFFEFWALTSPEWVCAAVFPDYHHISCHHHNGLFAPRCEDSSRAVESYRVCQVATILSNLVLVSKFVSYLAKHNGVLRFLLLASSCDQPVIQATAMDVLIEIGPYLIAPSPSPSSPPSSPRCYSPRLYSPRSGLAPCPWEGRHVMELVFRSLCESVMSHDRAIVLKSLEVLTQSSLDSSNQELLATLGKGVWQHVFKLLLLPDVQILLLCLDLLYSATSDNSPIASLVTSVYRWCDVLVSVLCLDVRSFGERSLSKIQVLRVSPASSSAASSAMPSSSRAPAHTSSLSSKSAATSLNSSVPIKVGSNLLKMGHIPSSKILSAGQTIRIGNLLIPVVTAASPMALGQILTSSASSLGQVSATPNSQPNRSQGSVTPSSVHSLKMSSPLTIQQLQTLLSRANIPGGATPPAGGVTPPVSMSRSSLVGGSGGSSVSINRSATGGSGVTICKVETGPGVGEAKNKPLSNLLRSYLAKTGLSSSPSVSSLSSSHRDVSPTSSTNITSTQSTRSTPSPTPSSLSSSSGSLSTSGSLVESFATLWLEGTYEECPGSYVSQLEIYSLYLLASTKAGISNTLSSTEFSALLRKVFSNALSTRVSVGNQAVNMMAGLARKKSSSITSENKIQPSKSSDTPSSSQTTSLSSLTSTASQCTLADAGKVEYTAKSTLAMANKMEEATPTDLVRDATPTSSMEWECEGKHSHEGTEEAPLSELVDTREATPTDQMETGVEEAPPSDLVKTTEATPADSMETKSEEAPPSDSMEVDDKSEETLPIESMKTESGKALLIDLATQSAEALPADLITQSDEAPPTDLVMQPENAPPTDLSSKDGSPTDLETLSTEAPPTDLDADSYEAPSTDLVMQSDKAPPTDLNSKDGSPTDLETPPTEAPPTDLEVASYEASPTDLTTQSTDSNVAPPTTLVTEADSSSAVITMETQRDDPAAMSSTSEDTSLTKIATTFIKTLPTGAVRCVGDDHKMVITGDSQCDDADCGTDSKVVDASEAVQVIEGGGHADGAAGSKEEDTLHTTVTTAGVANDNGGHGQLVASGDGNTVSVGEDECSVKDGIGVHKEDADVGNGDVEVRSDSVVTNMGGASGANTESDSACGHVAEALAAGSDNESILGTVSAEEDSQSHGSDVIEGVRVTEAANIGVDVDTDGDGGIVDGSKESISIGANKDGHREVITSEDAIGSSATAEDASTTCSDAVREETKNLAGVGKNITTKAMEQQDSSSDQNDSAGKDRQNSDDRLFGKDYCSGKDHHSSNGHKCIAVDTDMARVGVVAGNTDAVDEDEEQCGGVASSSDDGFSDGMESDGGSDDEPRVRIDNSLGVGVVNERGVSNGDDQPDVVVFNGLSSDKYDDEGSPSVKRLRLSLDEDLDIEDIGERTSPPQTSTVPAGALPATRNGTNKGTSVHSKWAPRGIVSPSPTNVQVGVAGSSSVSSVSSGFSSSTSSDTPPAPELLQAINLQPIHSPNRKRRTLDCPRYKFPSKKRPRFLSSPYPLATPILAGGTRPPMITSISSGSIPTSTATPISLSQPSNPTLISLGTTSITTPTSMGTFATSSLHKLQPAVTLPAAEEDESMNSTTRATSSVVGRSGESVSRSAMTTSCVDSKSSAKPDLDKPSAAIKPSSLATSHESSEQVEPSMKTIPSTMTPPTTSTMVVSAVVSMLSPILAKTSIVSASSKESICSTVSTSFMKTRTSPIATPIVTNPSVDESSMVSVIATSSTPTVAVPSTVTCTASTPPISSRSSATPSLSMHSTNPQQPSTMLVLSSTTSTPRTATPPLTTPSLVQSSTATLPSSLLVPSTTTLSTAIMPTVATPPVLVTPLTTSPVFATPSITLYSSPSLLHSKDTPSSPVVSASTNNTPSRTVLSKYKAAPSLTLGPAPLAPIQLGSSLKLFSQMDASVFLAPRVSSSSLPQTTRSPSPSSSTRHPSLPPPSTTFPRPSIIRSSSTPPSSQIHSSSSKSLSTDFSSHSSGVDSHSIVSSSTSGERKCVCLWNHCNSVHFTWSSLLAHVSHTHLSSLTFPAPCGWTGCVSKVKRRRASLLTHLQACHCVGDGSAFVPPNIPKILARLKTVPTMQNETENPLTKAARLTAALILRNLAKQLPEARRKLHCYEHMLCQVALSDSEASSVVSHCLQIISSDR